MSFASSILLAGATLAALSACSGGADQATQPIVRTTALRVMVRTTGATPDSVPYRLILDNADLGAFAQNDSTELGVPPGSHSAEVRPSALVRARCRVSGGGTFDVPEGTIVPVLVTVGC